MRKRCDRHGRVARLLALALLAPMLILQPLEAASLFCKDLAHASVLSVGCPHHEHPDRSEHPIGHGTPHGVGSDANTERHTGADTQPASSRPDSGVRGCTCPGSGQSLPDGLVLAALGGLGLPVAPVAILDRAAEAEIHIPTARRLRPAILARCSDHPPKSQA